MAFARDTGIPSGPSRSASPGSAEQPVTDNVAPVRQSSGGRAPAPSSYDALTGIAVTGSTALGGTTAGNSNSGPTTDQPDMPAPHLVTQDTIAGAYANGGMSAVLKLIGTRTKRFFGGQEANEAALGQQIAEKVAASKVVTDDDDENEEGGHKPWFMEAAAAAAAVIANFVRRHRIHWVRKIRRVLRWVLAKFRRLGERIADRIKKWRKKEPETAEVKRAREEAERKRLEAERARERADPHANDGSVHEAQRIEREAAEAERKAAQLAREAKIAAKTPTVGEHFHGAMGDVRHRLFGGGFVRSTVGPTVALAAIAGGLVYWLRSKGEDPTVTQQKVVTAAGNAAVHPQTQQEIKEKGFVGGVVTPIYDSVAGWFRTFHEDPQAAGRQIVTGAVDTVKYYGRVGGAVYQGVRDSPEQLRHSLATGELWSDPAIVGPAGEAVRDVLAGDKPGAASPASQALDAALADHPETAQGVIATGAGFYGTLRGAVPPVPADPALPKKPTAGEQAHTHLTDPHQHPEENRPS